MIAVNIYFNGELSLAISCFSTEDVVTKQIELVFECMTAPQKLIQAQ